MSISGGNAKGSILEHGLALCFDDGVFRRAAAVVVLLLAVIVGVLTAWQWGVLILFGAIFLLGLGYLAGVEIDSTQRWGRAVAGDDPDDEGHWSRR